MKTPAPTLAASPPPIDIPLDKNLSLPSAPHAPA